MSAAPIAEDRILRFPEVVSRCGLSRATIYRLIDQSEFPHAVALGGKSIGWRESAINAWIATRDQAVKP